MAKKLYTLTLTPLTGVHIGTGEELTPLDYKIASKVGDVDFKKLMYWKFSSDRILQRLIEDKKELTAFERASVQGNMKELQQFFQEHCTEISDTDYPCEITKEFLKTYKANLGKDPYQNAAKVLQMYHTEGTPRPVIPGSSLKGAIRTALLNSFLADLPTRDYDFRLEKFKQEKDPEKYEEKLQKILFNYNDAKNDPLRAVSISDCSFKAGGTQLVGGLKIVSFSEQTESLEPVGTQIQAEVLKGTLLKGNAISELQITIDEDLQKTPFPKPHRDDQPEQSKQIKAISFEDIRQSCNDFYWGEFQNEYNKFYKDVNDGTETLIVELKKRLEEAVKNKGQCIIRVGRWSQVEFVTFEENFRKPKTRIVKGRSLGSGGTRTLFDYDGKYVPMGWCILSIKEC